QHFAGLFLAGCQGGLSSRMDDRHCTLAWCRRIGCAVWFAGTCCHARRSFRFGRSYAPVEECCATARKLWSLLAAISCIECVQQQPSRSDLSDSFSGSVWLGFAAGDCLCRTHLCTVYSALQPCFPGS